MKKAVIFDFDGVIVDSEPVRYKTYKQLFRDNYSVDLPKKMGYELFGRNQNENIACFLKRYNLKGDVEKLIGQREKLLKEAFSRKEDIRLIPGLLELLKKLKEGRFKMAIASSSSKEYITGILKLIGILDFFDLIVSSDVAGVSKPNPQIFIVTAERLREKMEDCVVIEDSVNGIIAAKSAGMKTMAITSSFEREQLSQADIVVDRLDEIDVSDMVSD